MRFGQSLELRKQCACNDATVCVGACIHRAVCNQQDVQFRNRLISLDGKTYNMRRGMHTTVYKRQTPPMHWATLPANFLLNSQVLLDRKLDQLQVRFYVAPGWPTTVLCMWLS